MDNEFDPMGFVFISEQVSPDTHESPTNIKVHNENGLFFIEFDSYLQSFDIMNRNVRLYDGDNVWSCIASDQKIQALLKDNAWFGEMDHPNVTFKGQDIDPQRMLNAKMENTSHKIINPRRVGNLLMARIQTDSGTDAGINMAKKTLQGMSPAFSARAVANITNRNGKPYVFMKKLITYDWVLYPSHAEAHIIDKPFTESVTEPTVTSVAILPLKELLQYAGKKNVNSQMIMESFDLTADNIVGFDSGAKHIIMKDKFNTIYCNMDPSLSREINGYLSNL